MTAKPTIRVSVIIPALNEESCVTAAIASARGAGAAEVIVVDGGSADATRARAEPHATVVTCRPQRAGQMNAGARIATGDVLLFLHADTTLHPLALPEIERWLSDQSVVGGTFELRFDHRHPLLRFYAFFTRLRSPLFHYGDQAIFVRREAFHRLGGFAEISLMEDVEFLSRLRREGDVRAVRGAPVTTSARRFLSNGIVRQQLVNATIVALYHCGASPDRLAAWYRRENPAPTAAGTH